MAGHESHWRAAVHIVIMGCGRVGSTLAHILEDKGHSVAVIDHRPFGGTCALRGCDPKKMLVSGAEAIDMAHRMRGRGVGGDVRLERTDRLQAHLHRSGARKAGAKLC